MDTPAITSATDVAFTSDRDLGLFEQTELVTWYQQYRDRSDTFRFSFDCLDGIVTAIKHGQSIWHSLRMLEKHAQLTMILGHLIKIRSDLIDIAHNKLNRKLDSSSHLDLVTMKRDLVNWILEDQSKLSEIELIKCGGDPPRVRIVEINGWRPYRLTGSARTEAEYRVYVNRQYLSTICEYFVLFEDLDRYINNLTDKIVLSPTIYDRYQRIQNDSWTP